MRRLRASVFGFAFLLAFPAIATAQATITGTVRDSSGGVLPGVTVEASSTALIEKVRITETDGSGQYRIVELPPGEYRLSFSLKGFNSVVQQGVELSGSGVFTVPAEMRLGDLQEQIFVTAETPVVNVQGVQREVVLQGDFVSSLPATRNYSAILQTIPAINVGISISAETTPEMQLFNARGGQIDEGRITIDGLTVAAPFGGGGVSSFVYNTNDVTELQVRISGGLGETETGGPVMNIVPRSGGNTFRGSAFINGAGDWSRGENIDDDLRNIGITRGPALKGQYDTNGSFGGPVKRDQLWFYATARQFESGRVVETGARPNLAAGDPTRWDYVADMSIAEVRNVQKRTIYSGRLTGQTGKHRLSFSQENQRRCDGSTRTIQGEGCRQPGQDWIGLGTTVTSGEAHAGYFTQPYYTTQATWTMPKTNHLLLEAGYSRLAYEPVFGRAPSDAIFDVIPVTEQSAIDGHAANFTYRALGNYSKGWARTNNVRASATYVTGAHNMKAGYQGDFQLSDQTSFQNPMLLQYRFNQRSPNQFTINLPDWETAGRTVQHSAYVQDSWTRKRLTLQGAIRFDHAYSWSPAEGNGTATVSRWNAQPIPFERTVSVRGYDDITPRMGVAYDLTGNGKTALKWNFGKYLDAATNDSSYTVNNPANRTQRTMNRSWIDTNNDRVVDCDILAPGAQSPTTTGSVDTCGAVSGNSLRFGNTQTGLTQVNPAILGGWGVRPYDWQVGLALQHEVLPRVSVEVAYNRRWFGNFTVTDNRALGAADFESWIAVAPSDPRLPGGGGYRIIEYEITPAGSTRTPDNYVTFETDYGPARTNYWHGVEVTANARMRNGLTFQGGTSTGREVTDTCATIQNYSRSVFGGSFTRSPRNCHLAPPFLTSFRGSASYTVPRVAVLVSTIVRLSPSPQLLASYNYPNTYVRDQGGLGHLPGTGLENGNQTVALLDTSEMYAERAHRQVDMRFAKIFSVGRWRADVGADLYNIFNVNTPTAYDGTYDVVPAAGLGPGGEWLRPTGIVQPRFARLNVTVSF